MLKDALNKESFDMGKELVSAARESAKAFKRMNFASRKIVNGQFVTVRNFYEPTLWKQLQKYQMPAPRT